ncbi:MAG: osmotically-inducible protein OsmY [Verrucomicrobiales bacterium]|jgi:osmotically-inducible protein OsmY
MNYYLLTSFLSLLLMSHLCAAERPPDNEIAAALTTRFKIDPLVPDGIGVVVESGVANLKGTVPTLLAKDQATAITLSTRGIFSVVNRVEVAAVERPDVELMADVLAALKGEPATERLEVLAEVRRGDVRLQGAVDSLAEARLAERAARSVRGVRSLESEIRIDYRGERNDAEILEDVRRALATDVWITAEFIAVSVDDGVVKLRGVVGSAAEHARAVARAGVLGVVEVDGGRLKMDPFVSNPMQKASAEFQEWDSEAIRSAIEAGFANDPRIRAEKLGVEVQDDRTVVLSGAVEDARAKVAAGADAQDTFGVTSVKNFLEVARVDAVSDKQIVARAWAAFKRSAYLSDRSELSVLSEGGEVTLSGSVEFPFEAEMAEDLMLGLKGVYGVENRLKVDRVLNSYRPHLALDRSDVNLGLKFLRREEKLDDASIARDVIAELKWLPDVDASKIRANVDGRTVVLEGVVGSVRGATAATEAARVRSGLKVISRLQVK